MSLRTKAEETAIAMSYEAMRICLGIPTKYHAPKEVIGWMQIMAGLDASKPQLHYMVNLPKQQLEERK